MSFQEEKRESIKRYMLDKIRKDDIQYIQKTMENFEISVTTVKRYLKECLADGILEESAKEAGYLDVAAELHKGKLTTDPVNHSGEGIFFSSKIMSEFTIWSDNSVFYDGYVLMIS